LKTLRTTSAILRMDYKVS